MSAGIWVFAGVILGQVSVWLAVAINFKSGRWKVTR